MTLQIGKRTLGKGHPVFIIAEIGVNHEGDFDTCMEMVKQAADAGADAIKLQTVDPDENYVRNTPSWQLFRTCELSQDETRQVFDYARELGMEPFTTSPDVTTVNWVNDLGVDVHKISSGMMTNDVIIRKTAQLDKTMFMSTGMSTTEQIDHAVKIAKEAGATGKLALFQCTSQYPVQFDKINLAQMQWMAERYDVPVGFSDHSMGIEAAMVATTLGAVMIEKHFTLTPGRKAQIEIENNKGEKEMLEADFDHHIGLSPEDFKAMVDGVRRAEKMTFEEICKEIPEATSMVGEAERNLSDDLKKVSAGASRCLVVRQPIQAGEVFTEENVGLKRPFANNRGLEPYDYENVIGKTATANMDIDDPITEKSIVNFKAKAA